MEKHGDDPKPEQTDIGLPTTSVPSGPVECLGMTFPFDTERRKYFLEKLAEKLKDPEFRKIEGFPIGEVEDILALSDPPYYTACPNPWLADFVKQYGTPYNPKEKYHREPFAADVSEGKNHPIYNAHSYHTKVPHRAIMRYILHYTEPGDLVFDGFAGTGMTGVAARLCADHKEVQALGYKIRDDGTILNEQGQPFSKLGARYAAISDLSTIATFVSCGYTTPVNISLFEEEIKRVIGKIQTDLGWMFETTHTDGRTKGTINYTVFSDIFICPECSAEIVFWDQAVDHDKAEMLNQMTCSACSTLVSKRNAERAWKTEYDPAIETTVKQAKQVPVLIDYDVGNKRFTKRPDKNDIAVLRKISELKETHWFPSNRMPVGDESRRNDNIGITHTHHFYEKRTRLVLAYFAHLAASSPCARHLCFVFTSAHQYCNRLCRLHLGNYFHRKGGTVDKPLEGTLYFPSLSLETNTISRLRLRSRLRDVFNLAGYQSFISCQSLTDFAFLPNESVDYIFVDPPFGSNISYSDLNFLWESWLKVLTNNEKEAIESHGQNKKIRDYHGLILASFAEVFRVLKPGRWITIEFSNTKAAIWNSIQTALQEVGFVVANVSAIDKQKGSFKVVTTPTAVKQDLVISAYKPNGGLESRFAKKAKTEDGVWDFIRTHLGNLPVVKPKGGLLEPIVERDPRILFDRTVAFYVRHGIPVPISSPEFQAGLAEKFPERDGMYFLSDQAAEYDKVRMKMEGIGQLTLFVEDERSAVAWLRNYLKNKPCKYQDIQPEFFEQLNQSWKKWETRPELRALLDQYFLCYSGEGDVSPQIHSYLSTNFRELRNLPADHAMLRAKARDRWFVPDPRKNSDVEQLREKRLLEEFWAYMPPGYEPAARRKKMQTAALPGMEQTASKIVKGKRIAIVRTEAVRVGFNFCFAQNDYQTIIAVARHIPEAVIQNDEQLQMIYDSAVTRTGGEFE